MHDFHSEYSDVFVTCSKNDIRVWNTNTSKELLRITVPNMDCNAVAVSVDGKSIISGTFLMNFLATTVPIYSLLFFIINYYSVLKATFHACMGLS